MNSYLVTLPTVNPKLILEKLGVPVKIPKPTNTQRFPAVPVTCNRMSPIFKIKNSSSTETPTASSWFLSPTDRIRTSLCNWCRAQTDSPTGMVTKITKDKSRAEFLEYGMFCSDSCALAFAEDKYKDTRDMKWLEYGRLTSMRHHLETGDTLSSADRWELLDINGGPYQRAAWERNLSAGEIRRALPGYIVARATKPYVTQ